MGRDSGTAGTAAFLSSLAALDYPADGGLAAIDLLRAISRTDFGLGQLQDKAIPLSRFVVTRFLQVFLFG